FEFSIWAWLSVMLYYNVLTCAMFFLKPDSSFFLLFDTMESNQSQLILNLAIFLENVIFVHLLDSRTGNNDFGFKKGNKIKLDFLKKISINNINLQIVSIILTRRLQPF
ncbi:hypothetical protein ACJX0J_016015, partial [Zea mays]